MRFLCAFYIALSLSPLLASGYYSDDLINSTIKGQLDLGNISLLRYLLDLNQQWVTSSGRFFPVAIVVTVLISYISHHLVLYKLLLLSLVVVNALLLGHLLNSITSSRYVSHLSMLLLPLSFQFRLYHDPILSFSGMPQIFLSLILGALILLARHLEHHRRGDLIGSVLLYTLSLYCYEVALLLVPLFVILVVMWRRSRDATTILAPYAISLALALLLMVVMRQLKDVTSTGYPGIAINLQPTHVIKTFLLQVLASFPLSYYAGNPSQLFPRTFHHIAHSVAWYDFAVIALFNALYLRAAREGLRVQRERVLLLLGTTLMVVPAVLISLSLKYQIELRSFGVGMGYVPVYFQYHGVACALTGATILSLRMLARRRLRTLVHVTVLVLGSVTLLVNMQNNRLVVDKANIDLHYRRAALTRALQERILESVPEQAMLYILDEYDFDPYPYVVSHLKGWAASGYHWKSDALVHLYAHKRVKVVASLDGLFDTPLRTGVEKTFEVGELYMLSIKSFPAGMGRKEGYVELSRIQKVYVEDDTGRIRFSSFTLRSHFPPAS